jgi:hypothetical protein
MDYDLENALAEIRDLKRRVDVLESVLRRVLPQAPIPKKSTVEPMTPRQELPLNSLGIKGKRLGD